MLQQLLWHGQWLLIVDALDVESIRNNHTVIDFVKDNRFVVFSFLMYWVHSLAFAFSLPYYLAQNGTCWYELFTCLVCVAGFSEASYPSVGVFTQSFCSHWTCFCHIWLFLLISAAQYLWWTCTDWWLRWMMACVACLILFIIVL